MTAENTAGDGPSIGPVTLRVEWLAGPPRLQSRVHVRTIQVPAAAGVIGLTFARFIGAWGSTRPLPAASLWVFYLLQRVALVYAYPFAALAFVLVPFGAAAFFGKRLSSGVLIGTALIVAGICVTGLSRS